VRGKVNIYVKYSKHEAEREAGARDGN